MEKQDLRIIKTRNALVSAMFTLLKKQDFQSITVNDLCTEAMVSRSTFYVHFEDKYALLSYCTKTLHNKIFEEMKPLTLEERLQEVLDRIRSNVKIFKNLMMVNQDAELYEMIRVSFHNEVNERLSQAGQPDIPLPDPLEVITAFYSSGLTSAIMLWIQKDMPYSTAEMAACLMELLPLSIQSKKEPNGLS